MIREEDDDRVDVVEGIFREFFFEPKSSDHLRDARVTDIFCEWMTVVEDIFTSLIGDRRGESGRLSICDSLEFFLYFEFLSLRRRKQSILDIFRNLELIIARDDRSKN